MAEGGRVKDRKKDGKKSDKSEKKRKLKNGANAELAQSAFSLLADGQAVDATLSSLFAIQQPPVKALVTTTSSRNSRSNDHLPEASGETEDDEDEDDADDVPASEEGLELKNVFALARGELPDADTEASIPRRKRKKVDADEELEDAYMQRLSREEAKETDRLAKERGAKRQKVIANENGNTDGGQAEPGARDGEPGSADEVHDQAIASPIDSDDEASPPPKHETQTTADEELSKANRTVFVGNVSTSAIQSKAARKTLMAHLGSFFSSLAAPKDGEKHKLESLRFRSTPYATAMPKKASFAKQELMDATTKSTNAYIVYSSPLLAREAAKRLNGTVVLDRHIRVDEVAHPAKVDHRRCVFVGNLGFVDDESNIQQANEDEGREKRKPGKQPGDVEEGLWRTFGKCGQVESVRVIRDSTTRVGKGIAYVQFADENSVEAALLYDEKKFPPMLPRKLRVSRAKAQKRNAKPGSGRPGAKPNANGYQRKITAEEASKAGRAGKLLGRAAAAQMRRPEKPQSSRPQPERRSLGDGIQKPEAFIFEGHRATAKQGKSGLKLGGKGEGGGGKKKARVTQRSKSFKAKKGSS